MLNRTTPEIQQENEDLRLESDSKVPTSVLNEDEIDLDLLDLLPEGSFFILANFSNLRWQFFKFSYGYVIDIMGKVSSQMAKFHIIKEAFFEKNW